MKWELFTCTLYGNTHSTGNSIAYSFIMLLVLDGVQVVAYAFVIVTTLKL